MLIRDRITGLRRVKASELRPNPKNWRTHPQAQQDALKGVLAEVGIADACIARELSDGTLELLDGHLRTETMTDQEIPVLVVDLDDAEAATVLATLDPLAAMAEADAAKLDELLRDVQTGSAELATMLEELAEDAGVIPDDDTATDSPFDDFDPPAVADDCVPFKFGDYSGQVQKLIYDSFVTEYRKHQTESGEPMLTDVLRAWLNV